MKKRKEAMQYFAAVWIAVWVVVGLMAWGHFGDILAGLVSVWAPLAVGIWVYRKAVYAL